MEDTEAAMSSQTTLLPLYITFSKPSFPDETHEDFSPFSSTRTEHLQYDEHGSDAAHSGHSASSPASDYQPSDTNTIALQPSDPTTPISSLLSLSQTSYKLLAAHHPTIGRLYKIEALPEKGLGMRATALVPAGTRLLAETPVLTVKNRDWAYETTQRMAVISSYIVMPHPQAQLFDALHHTPERFQDWHALIETEYNDAQPFGPDDPPRSVAFDGELSRIEQGRIMAVFSTNAFGVDGSRDSVAAAICPEASRINHSCCPNMQFAWSDAVLGGAITMHATRDIQPGEEITAGYIDLYKSTAERQETLRDNYGFDCTCTVCGAGDAAICLSDCRREMIRVGLAECRAEKEDEPWRRKVSAETKELLTSIAALHQEEGLLGLNYGNTFYIGIAQGDRYYMEQYLAVLVHCVGDDHKWVLRMRKQIAALEVREAEKKTEAEAAAVEYQAQVEAEARDAALAESSTVNVAAGHGNAEADVEASGAVESPPEKETSACDGTPATTDVAARPATSENEGLDSIKISGDEPANIARLDGPADSFVREHPRSMETGNKRSRNLQNDYLNDDDDEDHFDDGAYRGEGERGLEAGEQDEYGSDHPSDLDDSDDDDEDWEWQQIDTVTITRRGVSRTFRLVPLDHDHSPRGRAVQRSPALHATSGSYFGTKQMARKSMSSCQDDIESDEGDDEEEEDVDEEGTEERDSTSTTQPCFKCSRIAVPSAGRHASSSPMALEKVDRMNAEAAARSGFVPTARERAGSPFHSDELREINAKRKAHGLFRLQTARKGSSRYQGEGDDEEEGEPLHTPPCQPPLNTDSPQEPVYFIPSLIA